VSEREKLAEVVSQLLRIPPEDRERLLRILSQHHPRKILVVLSNAYTLSRYGKVTPRVTLEEFERMLRRSRW